MIFTLAPSIPVAADEPVPEPTSVSSLYIGSNSGGEENADIHHLSGPDARRQLIVTATLTDGQVGDFSRRVKYESSQAGIVEIDESGWVTPRANGKATITASFEGLKATTHVAVESVETARRVSFPNEVVPVFTKLSCNGGGCHGKSEGQNGFRLSLLGFGPKKDLFIHG